MALILNIETSTQVCSVSLSEETTILAYKESFEEKSHAAQLTVFIEQILKEKNISSSSVDAIAVSSGPGSYTGLRIGVSVAKGFCYALDKPLISVQTLSAMTLFAIDKINAEIASKTLFCPMLDARRMEAYIALHDTSLNEVLPTTAMIIDENSFQEKLKDYKIFFFGNGSEKIKPIISHPNAIFTGGIYPSAKYMAQISSQKFQKKEFENTSYFEPFYLKDFVAKPSKKLL